eukprot:347873-Chlamydomonas_euryale.AAC.3
MPGNETAQSRRDCGACETGQPNTPSKGPRSVDENDYAQRSPSFGPQPMHSFLRRPPSTRGPAPLQEISSGTVAYVQLIPPRRLAQSPPRDSH